MTVTDIPATFAEADAPGWYSPRTEMGKRYRSMCYWFAAGYERAQRDDLKDANGVALPGYWDVPDHSDRFGRYGAWCADRYESGDTSFLASVIDLFNTFREEYTDDPPCHRA